jgi:hypothetical protein
MFGKRLFMQMVSEQGVNMSSQNDSYAAAGDDHDGGGAESEGDRMEKVVEKKNFEEVLLKIYFGTLEEQTHLIF